MNEKQVVVYEVHRDKMTGRVRLFRDGDEIRPRKSQALRNHSPDGFETGYGGSGPSQLALAILLDHMGEARADDAEGVYQTFKWERIAGANLTPGEFYCIPSTWIDEFLAREASI